MRSKWLRIRFDMSGRGGSALMWVFLFFKFFQVSHFFKSVGYGFKFCTRFAEANSSVFTPAGITWRNSTLICLQEALVSLLNQTISCNAILQYAFSTHPQCYVQSGVCNLPVHDLLAIEHIICGDSITCEGEIWQGRFWKQLVETLKLCMWDQLSRTQKKNLSSPCH